MTVATVRDLQAATVRLARAWVAQADGAQILGMCQGADCGAVMPQDMLVPNGGRGYLCPACADTEIARLRRRVAELEQQLQVVQEGSPNIGQGGRTKQPSA